MLWRWKRPWEFDSCKPRFLRILMGQRPLAACTSPPPPPLQPPPRVPHASPCGAPRASAPRHDPAHDPRWAPARETDDSDVDADSDVADERELRVPRVAVGVAAASAAPRGDELGPRGAPPSPAPAAAPTTAPSTPSPRARRASGGDRGSSASARAHLRLRRLGADKLERAQVDAMERRFLAALAERPEGPGPYLSRDAKRELAEQVGLAETQARATPRGARVHRYFTPRS